MDIDNVSSASDHYRYLLRELAAALGLSVRYQDFYGNDLEVSMETLYRSVTAMGFDASSEDALENSRVRIREIHEESHRQPQVVVVREGREIRIGDKVIEPLSIGYHDLDGCSVIVCPSRTWQPSGLLEGERWWGACIQLYAIRSSRNWGIGDFTDLAGLVGLLAAQGAAFVGLNPLHALFAHRPEDASPYSPSSRNALNALYLDVEAIADFHESRQARSLADQDDFRRQLDALREADEVDYPKVAQLKYAVFEAMWSSFQDRHIRRDSERARRFSLFIDSNPHLKTHAIFEALQAHLFAQDRGVWGWPAWPEEYRDPDGEATKAFVRDHEDRVGFYGWLQWQADLQLQAAQERAKNAGMSIGLYRDLAVGSNAGGSELWAHRNSYALGMNVGAPPDPLSEAGQDWGLPPLDPVRLKQSRYVAFIELIRANMRHAGALRLDHVMGLMRLFWTGPHGGTYMQYPLDDLLGILALESHLKKCMVIGEDLGNVAPSMREAMRSNTVLSYSPLYFERGEGGIFKPPAEWKPGALAVVGTHDLPTLAGYWQGEDIELAARLGLYPDAATHGRQVVERAQSRAQLLLALQAESLLPEGANVQSTSIPNASPELIKAIYAFLCRTPSQLLGVQLEDVTQQLLQVNVPGTTESQYPNWRKKLPVTLEDLAVDKRMIDLALVLKDRNSTGLQNSSPESMQLSIASRVPDVATAQVPRSTYRVQFHAGFTFADAAAMVPYLSELGISHLYASPWQAARAGSTHGYDVVDPNSLNPELGDEASFEHLCSTLRAHDMKQMLDIVPNHMGVLEAKNPWWLDVLEHGQASLHADTFDIEWNTAAPEMVGRVLLPVLGDQYGKVLEARELKVVFEADEGSFAVHYYAHRFPIDPRDYPAILQLPPVGLAGDAADSIESMLHAFAQLPARDDLSAHGRSTRARDSKLLKRRLARRVKEQPTLSAWIDACIASLQGQVGDAHSFDALDALIGRQAWRLAFWRVAGDDINYRRFFDINSLAALRMERDSVFEATHRRVLRWLQDGSVAALRIDHPDGLADPRAYFERLQSRFARMVELAGEDRRAVYLVVEKILAEHEDLPQDWPVHGGTGYRFSNLVNGLFIDTRNEGAITRTYAEFADAPINFSRILYESKRLIMNVSLASDLQWLTEALYRISRANRRTCDFTRNRLRSAIADVAAEFTVYRTYLVGDGAPVESDARYLDQAIRRAKRRGLAADVSVIDHLRDVLMSAPAPGDEEAHKRFVARWQQFTAPVMAKSMEDTAFYRYHRLVSLNDVGGDPRKFGVTPHEFHAQCESQTLTRPHWLLGTSTHDSKRSEDMRARLDVLSEMPDEWRDASMSWQTMNLRFTKDAQGNRAPSQNDEYLLYQTLVGIWPVDGFGDRVDFESRVQAYMQKAMREAKLETSWLNPDEQYESAVREFIAAILASSEFTASLSAFVGRIARAGFANSLNMTALKLTAPGVPDIYQGCETWAFNLVDPDNRRAVHFDALKSRLDGIRSMFDGRGPTMSEWNALQASISDGRIKQLLTWRLLGLRNAHSEVFARGNYTPLFAKGLHASGVLAFERRVPDSSGDSIVVIASRMAYSRMSTTQRSDGFWGSWGDTRIDVPAAEGGWSDWLTGRKLVEPGDFGDSVGVGGAHALALDRLLAQLPVAVLVPTSWITARKGGPIS